MTREYEDVDLTAEIVTELCNIMKGVFTAHILSPACQEHSFGCTNPRVRGEDGAEAVLAPLTVTGSINTSLPTTAKGFRECLISCLVK